MVNILHISMLQIYNPGKCQCLHSLIPQLLWSGNETDVYCGAVEFGTQESMGASLAIIEWMNEIFYLSDTQNAWPD